MIKLLLYIYLIILILIINKYIFDFKDNNIYNDIYNGNNIKCNCVNKKVIKYIKNIGIIIYFLLLITIFNEKKIKILFGNIIINVYVIINILLYIIYIVYLIIVILYIYDLKKEKCECSKIDNYRNIILISIIIGFIILLILLILISRFFFAHNYR